MRLQRIAEVRREIAGSRLAAVLYFAVVLICLAVASTWASGNAVAFAGVFLFALPIPVTWPLMDAAFARYAREPVVSGSARSRLHWVMCVLVGTLVSILIGGVASS
jgi:Mn2+/Fe2+ NRAMP family transporter